MMPFGHPRTRRVFLHVFFVQAHRIRMYAIYGVPFTINIPQMLAYIPYMDPSWILWEGVPIKFCGALCCTSPEVTAFNATSSSGGRPNAPTLYPSSSLPEKSPAQAKPTKSPGESLFAHEMFIWYTRIIQNATFFDMHIWMMFLWHEHSCFWWSQPTHVLGLGWVNDQSISTLYMWMMVEGAAISDSMFMYFISMLFLLASTYHWSPAVFVARVRSEEWRSNSKWGY